MQVWWLNSDDPWNQHYNYSLHSISYVHCTLGLCCSNTGVFYIRSDHYWALRDLDTKKNTSFLLGHKHILWDPLIASRSLVVIWKQTNVRLVLRETVSHSHPTFWFTLHSQSAPWVWKHKLWSSWSTVGARLSGRLERKMQPNWRGSLLGFSAKSVVSVFFQIMTGIREMYSATVSYLLSK